jgi:hypothetical protein
LEIILFIIYTTLFIYFIQNFSFFETDGVSKNVLTAIFILKIIFGFLVWGVYTYYYTYRPTADVFKYFDASEVLFNTLKTNPVHFLKMLTGIDCNGSEFNGYYDKMNFWNSRFNSSIYSDNHLIIRVNTLMRFFSFGFFHVHTVFFCFFSLTGLTAIYKTFIPLLRNKKRELFCSVFLLPSLLFWGSGVLKEGAVLFALGLLIYHFNSLKPHHQFNGGGWRVYLKSLLICAVTAILLGILKFYVLVALLPSLLFMFWVNDTSSSKLFLKYITVIVVSVLLGLNIHRVTSIQTPFQMLSQKQTDFNMLANGLKTDAYGKPIPIAGSTLNINKMEPTIISFLQNTPQALVNSLFRPFIWQSTSAIILLAAVENILVITFCVLCFVFAKPFSQIAWQYVLFCFSFAFIQLLFIGITTPVVGAIVRYKILAIPFLLIAFLLIADAEKIKTITKFWKR